MKIYKMILLLIIGSSMISCEDVITVDLDTAAPRLVIDASIDWVKGTPGNEQKIVLSTTTGYYSPDFPTVSGANITVTNSAGNVFTFTETPETGEYICTNFIPVVGETYQMVIILNGETYTATETLTATPNIEETIEQDNEGGMGGDEIEITFYYQDDPAATNYYLFNISSPRSAFPELSIEDDENSQGNMTPEYYSHEDLKPGDLVNIRLYGISERYYQYMNKLIIASGGDTGPWPPTPSVVRGNIVNQSNFNNFAFGYFRLAEVDTRDYVIQ
ncbi:DUF4249 family protein [Flavobacterium sp. Sd200]|uniref:DUF4249 domain-containing protein n=1 Tax=Flavobacterium sp. Sd200 TaxID=2692211 RepID=UPI00136E4CC3|nr:DUF4249 domain-containing protein [Flavobacterium sp. Sd200]MXN92376.1 DUF4249 family protein [Flavobacterium sp. Sd200]